MEDERRGSATVESPGSERGLGDELRALAQSFSALGRTAFREGRVLSAELVRSVRGVVDRAREEIERLTADRKP